MQTKVTKKPQNLRAVSKELVMKAKKLSYEDNLDEAVLEMDAELQLDEWLNEIGIDEELGSTFGGFDQQSNIMSFPQAAVTTIVSGYQVKLVA